MATSGSKDFDLAVDEYVEEAFERCGLQVRTGYDLKTAKRSLNLLFADWANRGLNRWTMKQETLNLANGVDVYPLGTLTISVANSANFSVAEVITGGTSTATASITSKPSATSLAITVPVGTFSVAETITGGTSGATTTVSSAVSFEDVQSSIDILSAVIRQNAGASNQSDTSISRIGRDSYLGLPSKKSTARPTQYYVDRQITPVIKLWAVPDSSTAYQLVYDRMVRIDDADGYTNNAEIPFRFYPCLSAGLSYYLAIKRAPERVQLLKAIYEEEFERAASEDRDRATLKLTPSTTYYNLV
tara:strand:- start:377 stop:1282 length:906 start_codon:yes stop_codon:yes gene_type:complete